MQRWLTSGSVTKCGNLHYGLWGFFLPVLHRTALYDGSFSATAPKLWNALPSDIRTCSSLDNFKKSAKNHFINCS